MHMLLALFRLGLGGLFLDQATFRAQREAPDGLRRGLLLVLLVGLITGAAGAIGNSIEALAQPSPIAVVAAFDRGFRALPLYDEIAGRDPTFPQQFDELVRQAQADPGAAASRSTFLTDLLVPPVLGVIGWLLYGGFTHLVARALGGGGTFAQTLSCTALAAGPGLLNVVLLIPFGLAPVNVPTTDLSVAVGSVLNALVAALTVQLFGLLVCYVAVSEVHGLDPRRSTWAVVLGPLLLLILGGSLFCCVLLLGVAAAGGGAL